MIYCKNIKRVKESFAYVSFWEANKFCATYYFIPYVNTFEL